MQVGSTDEGCAAPPARGRDLFLPWPVSPKHTPQKPRTLANEQAGGTVREKGCFVVKSLWARTSARLVTGSWGRTGSHGGSKQWHTECCHQPRPLEKAVSRRGLSSTSYSETSRRLHHALYHMDRLTQTASTDTAAQISRSRAFRPWVSLFLSTVGLACTTLKLLPGGGSSQARSGRLSLEICGILKRQCQNRRYTSTHFNLLWPPAWT